MRLLIFMFSLIAGMVSFSCNPNNNEQMNKTISDSHEAIEFACPMHSEVKGGEGGTCPKCGTKLEKFAKQGKVSMSLITSPGTIEAGKPVHLVFTPMDKTNTSRAVKLEETHEKKIHVIAVSEDLSWFDHIHAEPSLNGSYSVTETFPHRGVYFVYADYKPQGTGHQTHKFNVNVSDPTTHAVHLDEKIETSTGGYIVSVGNADRLKTGSIEIPIVVEKDGKKLEQADFENYLGAVAHIILISQKEKEFIHIHPESTEEYPIQAHAGISNTGIYRMWVQFQTNGTVHTADFTLNIKEGTGVVKDEHHQHGGHKH
jgi:hypothetical protein